MLLGKTASYYKKNPKARTVRLKQQKRYDSGNGSTGRTREAINDYHKKLGRWNTKNKKKKAAAIKANGGNPVDATHRKDGSIVYGDRKYNRGMEVRTRNQPSNKGKRTMTIKVKKR